jgi:hypothetical protein
MNKVVIMSGGSGNGAAVAFTERFSVNYISSSPSSKCSRYSSRKESSTETRGSENDVKDACISLHDGINSN